MPSPTLQFKRGLFANLPGLKAGEPGFTTDSYELYVGIDSTTNNNKFFGSHRYWTRGTASTGSGVNFVEGTNNGTQYITLKAPDTLSGITTFTLPSVDGTNGQILTTNGSGTLSFSSSAASSFTITGGTGTDTFNTGETLTFAGTASEIETAVTNNQVQIGLPNNVAITTSVVVGSGVTINASGIIASAGIVTASSFVGSLTGTASSTTNIPNLTGAITSVGTATTLGSFSSASLATALTDETGSGSAVFATSPTLVTPALGNATATTLNVSGIVTASDGARFDGVQIGINGTNIIDTVSGNLTLNSAGGTTIIDDAVTIQNNLTVNGNITVGGTTVTLRGTDVFIENKDIILGFTTSVTPNDGTANHAGVAIASTEGSPLVSFTASGINTLPDTYKQMMWFKSGTLGFSTDTFAFNYGVAIGTTTVANGVRLAVGSGITMTDTEISATTFRGALSGTATSTTNIPNLTGDITSNGTATSIASGVIVNDDINASAAIADTKLATISTALKVSNSATTATNANTASAIVARDGSGNFSAGTITASLTGTASTTTNIPNLTGAITSNNTTTSLGSFSSSNLATALTDETGSGVAVFATSPTLVTPVLGAASATSIEVSGAVNVGTALSAPTVKAATIQHSNATNAATIDASGNITAAQNLTISGNLYVNGSTTQVNTAAITVEDRTIELGVVDGAAPSSATTWDLGVLFNYHATTAKKSAVIWEQGDARFKFASVLAADSDGSNVNTPQLTVTTFAPIEIASLFVNDCAGASQVISCTGTERFLENITVDAGSF